MPKVEAANMRAVLFVEVDGEPYRVTLPNERMELLLLLAASLFDNGKLGLAPTTFFKFPPGVTAVTPQPVVGSTGADWRHIGYARYVVPEGDGDAQLVCCGPDEPGAFRISYKPKERTPGVTAALGDDALLRLLVEAWRLETAPEWDGMTSYHPKLWSAMAELDKRLASRANLDDEGEG